MHATSWEFHNYPEAALTSALTFSVGAALPLLMVVVSPYQYNRPVVFVVCLRPPRASGNRSEGGRRGRSAPQAE